jgi:hypothetical protein
VSQLCNYGLVVGALLAFLVDWICFKFIYKTVTRTVEKPDNYLRIVAALFPLILYSSVMVAVRSAAILTNDQFGLGPQTEQLRLIGRVTDADSPDKYGRYFLNVEVEGKPQKYSVCHNTLRFLKPDQQTYPVQIRMGYWGFKELIWQTPCPGESQMSYGRSESPRRW